MNSRYININDRILLEYSNNTTQKDYKYDIVRNGDTKRNTFYISYENAAVADYNRDNGAERLDNVNSNRWFYLDVDRFKAKPNLTFELNKQPIIGLRYNRLRIHLLSGYTMNDIQGFIMQIYLKDVRQNNINLMSFAFLRDFPNDNIRFNPEPLYINSKYYNRYIELDLLSPESLLTDGNYQFMVNELTDDPIDKNTLVYIDFNTISRTENNIYLFTDEIVKRAETVVDKYRFFGLRISEVDDYFEHYATFKNGFPTEFINNMAAVNRIWHITHKIEVFEQIGFQNIKTDEVEKIQRSNFDRPLRYRPILVYSDTAFSFSIKYTCIFTDTTTNEQFYRTSHLSKLNPRKYGVNLKKLNISGFTRLDVFHPSDINLVNEFTARDLGEGQIKFVNNYIRRINLAQDNVIEVTPFTNVYQFEFEESIAEGLEFFISFISDDGEKIYITDIEEENTDTKLFFKIQERIAERIRTFTNRDWYIIGVNPNGESTTIAKGTFII